VQIDRCVVIGLAQQLLLKIEDAAPKPLNAVPRPLIVPPAPLSAAGLATPYRFVATDPGAGACHEANADQSAFVEAAILDPATGTGTFICELLEHFRGQPAKLKYKYKEELYANEVAILPYYVANLNIEATYAAITGEYAEFPNLCFVDTLDNVGLHTAQHGSVADLFGSVTEENVARIKRQNSRWISVIIGNPPYNANQLNENENNKNRTYPEIDRRIKQTYIAESTAQVSASKPNLPRLYPISLIVARTTS